MKIHVPLGERVYNVIIQSGITCKVGELYREVIPGKKALLIADETVCKLYGSMILARLQNAEIDAAVFTFLPGEASKSLYTYEKILDACASFQLTGSDALIALGGGVTGDLVGFAAATYHRGIRFVQIPTTLLAMVDSSVGGKTGVNLAAGKNLAGAFWQPSLVICDPDFLRTLSPAHYADGIAECLKYGVLWDEALFRQLSKGVLFNATEGQIARCVELKRDVVLLDERDTGQRKLLNLGHTIGHAIEQASGYSVPHGAAVGLGMLQMARVFCPGIFDDIAKALRANGLPIHADIPTEKILTALLQDKKRAAGNVTIIVPERIGACRLREISIEKAGMLLEGWR